MNWKKAVVIYISLVIASFEILVKSSAMIESKKDFYKKIRRQVSFQYKSKQNLEKKYVSKMKLIYVGLSTEGEEH